MKYEVDTIDLMIKVMRDLFVEYKDEYRVLASEDPEFLTQESKEYRNILIGKLAAISALHKRIKDVAKVCIS